MLIKSADDQSKRVALLESLQQSPSLNAMQRRWLDDELWALRMGRSGERSAAHYLDSHYKDSQNLAVIHDLRLELDGEVAQIDHLIISRGFAFYLLETKNFSGDLTINEHGEFSVYYRSRGHRGIPSPLEQSRRHEKVLAKYLDRLGIEGRFSSRPQFFHVVLIDPKGTITRPRTPGFDTSNVIKADQFEAWRTTHVEKGLSMAQTLVAMANLRSGETVREWAQWIALQHRPADPLWLPDFMKPRMKISSSKGAESPAVGAPYCAHCNAEISAAEAQYCRNQSARFGGALYCRAHQSLSNTVAQEDRAMASADAGVPPNKRLVCALCGTKISYAEGRFCWSNVKRFGGLQYCRVHQQSVKSET